MFRTIAFATLGAVIVVPTVVFMLAQSSPGRCHSLPTGMDVTQYQAKLASENPDKYVLLQTYQLTRFVWEPDISSVRCLEGQYAVVFFNDPNVKKK